jgi:hypothetical protein
MYSSGGSGGSSGGGLELLELNVRCESRAASTCAVWFCMKPAYLPHTGKQICMCL